MNDWELFKGDIKLADIKQVDSDQPWFIGELSPCPEFEQFRPLFEKAQIFIKTEDFESEESESTFIEIEALQLSIKDIQNQKHYKEIMFTLENNEAWWRV